MASGINIKKSKVSFDKIPIEGLVKKFSTPLFVFSEKRVSENFQLFQRAFTKYYPNTAIFYSIKTNYELQILKTLLKLGSNAEAASGLEVRIAEKAGFKPSQLILDGPAWSDKDIYMCIKKGIKTFNVDSLDELYRLNNIAKKLNEVVRISFRINPEIKISILKSFIEGYIAKFGVPISKALLAYKEAQSMKYLQPIAISTHIGSMITDPNYYERTIDKLIDLAVKLKSELGINIGEINLGGGYGIQSLNYYSIQNVILEKAGISKYSKAPPIEEFGEKIALRFKKKVDNFNLLNLKLILEPGRFIASDSGILITKVVAVKDRWIFLDGGINLIPESIFFIRRGFLVSNKVGLPAIYKYNIAGPTLNTADVLAINQEMPKVGVGDTIIVLDAGAYSLSRSNQFTILRPTVVYVTNNGRIRFLRKTEEPADIINKLLL